MKCALLVLPLVTLALPSLAQCGCGKLRVAMDDRRSYHYRYYLVRELDTASVQAASTTQAPRQLLPIPSQQSRPGRKYIELPAFQIRRIQVEVTQDKTQQKMELTFNVPGMDYSYNLLFDFSAGSHYAVALVVPAEKGYVGFTSKRRERFGKGEHHWLKLTKQEGS